MDFYEVLDQVEALLQRHGRVTYRALRYQFKLDDEGLEALKAEFIEARCVAFDEGGKVLAWTGGGEEPEKRGAGETENPPQPPISKTQPPVTYTPPHLAERIRAEQAAMEARGATGGERKLVTHLFSDLKGSTALIEGLDPEDARAIVDPALQLMMDAVHRYEGYVAQALGDGIFALFGAPIAHEDHPQRALYAALRMQEEMRRYSDRLREQGHPPLLMRVGVNTGEVVVRSIRKEDLHTDYIPIGHSTNIAARMEQLAAPGSILVTEQTHKLTTGYFEFKPLGKTQVKGVEAPLNVYEVIGAGPLRTRLQVSARRGLTRFVGRHTELDQLRRALEQAKAGQGQIAGVMGEPGVGKSRLFYEFKLTSQSGYLVLEAFSVSYGKASPYLPIIELLKTYFQIQPQDDERQRKEKITGKVLTLDRNLEDTLPYLFALLGIEDLASSLQQMDPQIRRRRTFEALKRLFLRESLNQPLILIFEDLHWIDSEMQGFLDVLSESVASAKVLLLVNYRPEYRHEWGQKTYYTQLRLAPLGKEEAEEFLDALLGEAFARRGSPDPADSVDRRSPGQFVARSGDRPQPSEPSLHALKQLILEKTEGTPFFMEEVVQELVEQGVLVRDGVETRHVASLPSDLHIPTTVQGVLAARIDRLIPEEKDLLQQLAVIGREFPLSLVWQVVPQPEEELYRMVASLQRKEFLYEQPAFPEVEYLFKHALTQEVAYNSVLQERRKALHERTAQAIENLYNTSLEDHYSELAHHYTRSGNTQKAVDYLQRAEQQAVQHSANEEAIHHLTTALELLQTLPDTPERAQQELTLQILLGASLMTTKGWGAPEVERVYTRARALCQQEGEIPRLFSALWALSYHYAMRADYQAARELGEQCLTLAHSLQDSALLLQAHYMVALTWYCLGEFVLAREHYEQAIALYDPQQHHALAHTYAGQDPGVICQIGMSWILWHLGYPDQALKRSHEALSLAQKLSHPFSLAITLLMLSSVQRLRGEGRASRERAEAATTLSTERGFADLVAFGTFWRGIALAEQEQVEEGITQMRHSLAAIRAGGAEAMRPYYLGVLAGAYRKAKQPEEGLSVVAEALEIANATGVRGYKAELYRLRGELMLAQSSVQRLVSSVPSTQHLTPNPQAEACFQQALAVARQQQAKSLELRAATNLARLWQQQGKIAEARDPLL
jgi:predicted ATPase/class 3 adenylate cyclase